MQPALFHPKALETIRAFPRAARRAIGEAILELQKGAVLTMPLSRPMRSMGAGVNELRVHDSTGAYRAFYVVKSLRGILVFHAFEKRTQRTPPHEIEVGRRRLKEIL